MEQDGFQYFHSPNREKKTAVALEYEPTDQAPKVIASGQGYIAERSLIRRSSLTFRYIRMRSLREV